MRGVVEKCLEREATRKVAVDVLEAVKVVEGNVLEFAAADMRLNIPNARIDFYLLSLTDEKKAIVLAGEGG